MVTERRFHWVALASDPEKFEPAEVYFEDGRPKEVWTIGSDVESDPDRCIIAEPITKKEG